MQPEIITDDIKGILKDTFKELKEDVSIEVYTKDGVNDRFNETTVSLIKEISRLTDKVKPEFYKVGDENSKKRGVLRSPTVVISPDRYSIRFIGAPLGEEGRSLIMAITLASTGSGIISRESLKRISGLTEKRKIQVFVSHTCPYCPQQVLYAVSTAIAKRDLISVEIIEIYENKDLAQDYGVVSVPQTFINGSLSGQGLQPEEFFIGSVMTGTRPEFVSVEVSGEPLKKDLVIIGGGPAGLTAAIYAERAGLRSVVLEKDNVGGQMAIAPVVENYPGFMSIGGRTLVDLIASHASQYADIHQSEEVKEIKKENTTFKVKTNRALYISKGIIIVTGARSKALNVPGEKRLYGRGVSYCAECDGYIFKDGKRVIVVGGGNAAVVYALYLHNLGAKVTLVHRRDKLRAEMRLQESLFQAGIKVMYGSEIIEIIGDKFVSAVRIADRKNNTVKALHIDGVFIAIGYEPNNSIAKALGLELNEEGYIKTDGRQRTSMPMVYAAGDITGGVKQIVVAVSQGAVAALSSFEDIKSPYWREARPPGGQ